MNDKYKKLYQYLSSNGMTDLDENQFFSEYSSNPQKIAKLHSYLTENKMTDLDANAFQSSYFGVKKKEVSQSTLDQGNTSSGRLSNTTTKPTASSSSPEILTDYLGKSKKKYKFEDNQWYEENPKPQVAKSTPSKFGGTAKTYGQELKFNPNAAQGSWKPIEEESRVKALNYYYKKEGSLATEQKVFTNYDPEKKDNFYRIENGQWERKVPKGSFVPVNDEIATQALNKRYGQNVVFTPTDTPVVKKKEDPKFMDINSNLTAKTEEDAIGYLEENYGKYGFEFNQEGLFLMDQIRVRTKDGKKEEVFEFDQKDPKEADRLRAFLEENKTKAYSGTYNYLDEKVRNQSKDIPKGEGRSQQEVQDYLKAVQIKKGEYILSDDYLNNFKKLDADEMKDQITNVIGKSGLNSKTIQEFYKTDAYKAYKTKKADANKSEQEKINDLYDQSKYAKLAGDKAGIKDAQNRIDAYLTNDVIADNVKNYDMQLNDLKNRNKQLETEYSDYEKQVNKFNSDKTIIDQKVKSGEISREQYNGMIDGLNQRSDELNNLSENIQTKAQKIKLETDNVSTSQKKLNYVAGKYVAAKEKEGGAIGFAVNSILNGVSGAFIEPFANYAVLGNQYEDLSPEEKQYYKDKKYTKDQVENILDNKAILKAKNEAKQMLISSVGFEETTQEYMKSGDRGFIATALGGVLQSLPAMATGVLGKAASFTGLAAQAYSGIEEEMLNDPDFQTTSVGERSIIAIPYAIGMGILENAGLTNMIKGNSVTGKALQGLVTRTIASAPKGATQDMLNKLVTKEIESNLAKGVIKITQAGLAEFETGATQSLVLDQGLKQIYNVVAQRNMTADEKKNLSQGEFFDTADSFGELKTQTFEDGLAEMIGGVTLGAVGTLSQRILKGNVSIYNADDVEFLKNVAQDDNFKKLFVSNLKTSMLNGSMTKGQAQDKLDALNEIQAVFTKLPDNISKEQMKQSMDLVVEKTKLEKERTGKDPALVAAQTERINAINDELETISKNAVQEQTTSEVSVQPGAKVGGEVAKGESQAESQVIAEEVSKAKEEVDQYIADAGSEARIGSVINPLVEKMAAAENIDDADIDSAIETIFNEVDSLEKSDQYSPETKKAISEKLLNIADKLDNYEFRTTTETVATTKAGAATTTRKTSEAVQKINAERYFNGVTANVNGQEVTFTDNKGRVEATMPNGEVVVLDTPTISVVEDGFEFDDNGALEAVTVTDRLGNNVRFTGDIALDLAIRDRENKLGVVEQAEFETAYQEVKKNYVKENKNLVINQKETNLAPDETGKIQPERTGDGRGRTESRSLTPLEGAPAVPGINGPDPQIVAVAEKYAADNGIDLKRQSEYVEVDEERAKRLADAYEQMADDPQNPKVKEAYQDLVNQTIAQYQALVDAGYKFWFMDLSIPSNEEYASTPYNALRDLRQNKEMGVFPTTDGYGEDGITQEQIEANPMLADTGLMWPIGGVDGKMMPVLVNDLFRAVHDAFGHGLEGAGFRARGEENAWQAHVRLFTGPAIGAITSETRGQNSWVNFGPEAEFNRTASGADTKYAPQKVGLMPNWTWQEGRAGDIKVEIETPVSQTENQLTERNARTMSVKYKRNPIVRAAINVLKALPGVKIYLHENTNQYISALANISGQSKQSLESKESAGSYIDGEIHLDMSQANLVTLLHEAFHHALVVNGIKGKYIIDMAKGLRDIIKDKDRLDELDKFISQYEEETDQETLETRADEFVAQLGGILAENQEEITTTGLTKFMALINRIFKKLGLGNVFTKASTSQDAVNFINAITRGLNVGEDISGSYDPNTGKIKRQAVTVMEGKESMKKFGLKEGKNITRKIGEALEARQRAKYGTIAQKDNSPEARKKISNWMVDEVKYFVSIMGDKSGKGWYGELYQNSLDAMSKIFPEMKTDQNARDLFTMLVAITSDGQKVMTNFKLASEAYDYYKKNGVMPATLSGLRVLSFEANLKRINELLVEYNGDIAAIKKDLMDVRSIQDINKERKIEGLPPLKTSWPVSFKAPFAASVFGPKLGMFFSNLSGNEAYPTLDRWWSRTFNRYRGTLIPAIKSGFTKKGEAIGLDRFKSLLGNPGMSNEEALLASKSYRDSYAAKGYKNGTEAEKAANTIYKTAFENINDAPFNGGDRQFMYDTISDAVNKLNKDGYELSIADVQAILWYFEKNLYKTLGVQAKIEGISYEDAANYTYDKWKESGQKFNYEIKAEEEGQAVEDADEDIEEGAKGGKIKFQKQAPNGKPSNLNDKQWEQVRTPAFKKWFGDWENDPKNASKVVDDNGEPRVVFHGTNAEFDEFKSDLLGSKNWLAESAAMGFFFAGNQDTSKAYTGMNSMDMLGLSMTNSPILEKANNIYGEKIKQAEESIRAVTREQIDIEIQKRIDVLLKLDEAAIKILLPNGISDAEGLVYPDKLEDARNRADKINEENGNKERLKKINSEALQYIEDWYLKEKGLKPQILNIFLNIKNPRTVLVEDRDNLSLPDQIQEAKDNGNDGVIFNNLKDGAEEDDIFVAFEPNQIKSATENVGTFSAETPKIKFQKAPKILGQKPTVVIVNDEAKALIDQIKLEVRAQREQKKAQTEVRKSISDSVKALVKKGSINLKQASTIISTLNRVNLDNPEMVKRFNDYIAKVFDRAEYIDKIERATSMKRKIKQNLKGASNPFAIAAKGFSQLEPKWVENIDEYIAIAQAVYDSVRKSTARKGVINWKQEADFQTIAKYVFDEEARQTEVLLGNLRSLYERITGKSSDTIGADVMQAELKDLNIPEDFSADVLDQIEEKLAEFEQMVEDTDPEVVQKAASIDPTIIPTKEAIRILDALDTYFMNGSTAGLNNLMDLYTGKENAIKFKYKARPLRAFRSEYFAQKKFQSIVQFNMILERKFGTKEATLAYKKASGIQDIENGANKAEAQAMKKQKEYMAKFGKIKGFNSAENIFQRGALANLLRTMVASEEMQQAEFDRNIEILRNSIDTLNEGNSKDKRKAVEYKKVLTQLGVFNPDVDIEMVLKNANQENINAVNFVIDMFGEIVDPLSDLALGMYNQILTQDVNYTPYVYKMTELAGKYGSSDYGGVDKDGKPKLNFFGTSTYANQTFDKNKAGVLMPITRPKEIRAGMHIDLDFDNNMFRQYRNALVDLYTAGPIRQLEGFFGSEQNKKILGSNEDQDIIYSALVDYIRTKKGTNFVTDDGLKFLNKISDYMAQFGAARALVGIGQFVNQFSSGMTNTIVNAGEYIRPGDFSKDIFEFMANSGRSIANVGGDEILVAMGEVDKSIERADLDNRPDQYVLKFIAKENMRLFNVMVAYPDAVARKLAWMAYYRKSMVEQGLLGYTEAIDTTKINDTAADYAQLMVDRNMDATDAALRGSLFRNRNASVKILRSIFLPFSSFGLNQKNRMWNDLNALASGRDMVTSARSIASIAAELVVYNAIRYHVAKAILGAALSLLGYDDDDQEELYNKLLNNARLSSWSKLFTDIISPIPLLDNQTLELANKAMKGSSLFAADPEAVQKYVDKLKAKGNLTDEEIEEKKLAFEEKNARSFFIDTEANKGSLSIQYEKAAELMDLVNAWRTGEFVDDNKNERFLSKDSQEKLTAPLMMKFAATVYGTRELDQIANKSFKIIKDAESMSSTQQDNYKEVKKELGRDLTEFERGIIKEKRTVETALQIIKFVEKNGGLNKEKGFEYLKLLDIYPKPGRKMLIDIQNGKTAKEIIKKNTE